MIESHIYKKGLPKGFYKVFKLPRRIFRGGAYLLHRFTKEIVCSKGKVYMDDSTFSHFILALRI